MAFWRQNKRLAVRQLPMTAASALPALGPLFPPMGSLVHVKWLAALQAEVHLEPESFLPPHEVPEVTFLTQLNPDSM